MLCYYIITIVRDSLNIYDCFFLRKAIWTCRRRNGKTLRTGLLGNPVYFNERRRRLSLLLQRLQFIVMFVKIFRIFDQKNWTKCGTTRERIIQRTSAYKEDTKWHPRHFSEINFINPPSLAHGCDCSTRVSFGPSSSCSLTKPNNNNRLYFLRPIPQVTFVFSKYYHFNATLRRIKINISSYATHLRIRIDDDGNHGAASRGHLQTPEVWMHGPGSGYLNAPILGRHWDGWTLLIFIIWHRLFVSFIIVIIEIRPISRMICIATGIFFGSTTGL